MTQHLLATRYVKRKTYTVVIFTSSSPNALSIVTDLKNRLTAHNEDRQITYNIESQP